MEIINYTLPEFAFLDGNSHLGDTLKNRTVLQHIRSNTVLEVVDLSEISEPDFTAPSYGFSYINRVGVEEQHLFLVHFSFEQENLPEIFKKCEAFYLEYLRWEDEGAEINTYGQQN